jgi:predicted Zn-dependent peptidase
MIDTTALDDFRFSKTTLSNGLDVITRHQPQLPIVSINLWYHVGSKNEERDQRGFTHLFEHLMFEGSKHFPGDFFKYLQPLGASINGSTSSDRTNYFVDLPTAHAERALAMESDRMAHLLEAIDDKTLRIQKDVVKNEYRQNYANRPYGLAGSLLAEALYPPHHPYSWLTIGIMEDIERATMEDVSAFFRRFYVPSNASLTIVGDLSESGALGLAERYFGSIPGGTEAVGPWTPEGTLTHTREILLHDRVELDRLYLLWPTVRQFDSDDAPLVLLGDVLALGRSSRLYRKLVIDEEIAQDITAFQSGRELAGSFGIVVTLRPSRSIREARDMVDAELDRLAARDAADLELDRVQTQRVASFFYALEHMGGFGGIADRLNAYNVFRGDPGLIATDVVRFQKVSGMQVRDAAARYLAQRPRVSLLVMGRKPAVTLAPLDRSAVPPAPEPTLYRAPLPTVAALRCGLPLWVFPTKDLPTVVGAIVTRGGAGLQEPGRSGLAELVASMLDEGTTSRSSAEIALSAEAMGASVTASCGWDGFHVGFRCLKGDLAKTLDLACDILLNPTFPQTEWNRVHGQTLAALRAERDSAEARAYRALLAGLYEPLHPYRHPLSGTEASVRGIVASDLKAFHARAVVPDGSAVIIAGNFDPDRLARELDQRLSAWPGTSVNPPEFAPAERALAPRLFLLDRPGAPQAVIRAGHVGLARLDPDLDPILIVNQVLGGQFSSRLNAKLREERGFTYGVRSQFDCRRAAGPFSIGTAVQSDQLATALDDIRLELAAIVTSRPPSQEELDLSRRALLEGQPRYFETPSALVNRYGRLFLYGLPIAYEAEFADRLLRIDRDALLAAATSHIHPDALVVVVVADAVQATSELERLEWVKPELIQD